MLLEKHVRSEDLPKEPWSDGELLWMLYRENDWSQRTIAYELGVAKERVLKGLIENNVLRPWTDKETLERALDNGLTPSDIARKWNCSELTIRRWMERRGIKKRAELTEDLLRELYGQQKLTVDEIAEDLGYAPVEVHMALREHGIETRDGSRRFQ